MLTHLAIIPDGNRRWARARGLPPMAGHQEGYSRAVDVAGWAEKRGVKYVTFFVFSTENWKRSQEEVGFLMGLFERLIEGKGEEYVGRGYRVKFLGSRVGLSEKLLRGMRDLEERSAKNSGMTVSLCLNYGGRRDLTEAVRRMIRDGVLERQVDEAMVARYLSSAGLPDPDAVIRTSGERRLSNFLLWETAYAELLFVDCLWPDMTERIFDDALSEYDRRQRRIGA